MKDVKPFVVPELSDRAATRRLRSGNETPGFSSASSGSSQLTIRPLKIFPMVSALSLRL